MVSTIKGSLAELREALSAYVVPLQVHYKNSVTAVFKGRSETSFSLLPYILSLRGLPILQSLVVAETLTRRAQPLCIALDPNNS